MPDTPTGRPYGERQALEGATELGEPDIGAAFDQADFRGDRLRQPSQRPNEPITAGLSTGPGPGPAAVGPVVPPSGPSVETQMWARWIPGLELLASAPGASRSTRQFVRRIRSQLPPNAQQNRPRPDPTVEP